MTWLLDRIQSKTHDDNRGYAAELLSILLQSNVKNRLELGRKDGVETILKVLSVSQLSATSHYRLLCTDSQKQYRRRDPIDADETEFMENVFDALCSALGESKIKELFLASEGIDLMVLMMKCVSTGTEDISKLTMIPREKLQSRSRSIKTLDYAMSGPAGSASCEAFIEALGLKTLFAAFMGKVNHHFRLLLEHLKFNNKLVQSSKKPSSGAPPTSEDAGHVLGILSSLFTNIPSETPARLRLLTKFVENNYEKADKLLEIRDSAHNRLTAVDAEIEKERKQLVADGDEIGAEEEDTWYLRRLDGGLFTLQTVDYILAWICMEDDGVSEIASSHKRHTDVFTLNILLGPVTSNTDAIPQIKISKGYRTDIASLSR